MEKMESGRDDGVFIEKMGEMMVEGNFLMEDLVKSFKRRDGKIF